MTTYYNNSYFNFTIYKHRINTCILKNLSLLYINHVHLTNTFSHVHLLKLWRQRAFNKINYINTAYNNSSTILLWVDCLLTVVFQVFAKILPAFPPFLLKITRINTQCIHILAQTSILDKKYITYNTNFCSIQA